MTRREFVNAAALQVGRRPPNVVVILTDQQTARAMSGCGNRWVRTPNMDRLVREGTRFENSWCASPVCSPSRSTLITGCWPHRTGVVYNGDKLNPEVPTVGEAFGSAGYESVWAGKWHLPDAFPGAKGGGFDRGFRFLPFEVEKRLMAFGDFTDEPIAKAAADFIKGKHEKPFFLGVSVHNPHDICYWVMNKLPAEHPSGNDAAASLPTLPGNHARTADEPEFIARCRERKYYGEENTYTKEWNSSKWQQYLNAYYRMTERVDHTVGVVLDALRDAGLERDTIVVFTSDHGEGMAAHGWVVKLMLWEEVVGVPLIFRWPGKIAAGRVDRESLVSGADIVPTVCDLAGVALSKEVHGESVASSLLEKKALRREALFAQLAPDTKDHAMQGRAVRTARHKYVRFSWGERPDMLFDVVRDPGETRNLAAEMPREVTRMRGLLDGWMRRIGDEATL